MGQDELGKVFHQIGVCPASQQGGDGVPGNADAGPENEACHGKAHKTVHIHMEQAAHHIAQKNPGGGDDIVAAVGGGSGQGDGADALAQGAEEGAHPQLDAQGGNQHPQGNGGSLNGLRVKDLLERGLCQFQTDDQNQGCYHQPGQVLIPGMAVRVLPVGRPPCQLKTGKGHDGGTGVGQIVHGVGHNGDGPGQKPCNELTKEEENVAQNPRDPGHFSDGGMDRRILRILIILYKQAKQQRGHGASLPE